MSDSGKSSLSIKSVTDRFGLPTLIITVFWIIILIMGVVNNISLSEMLTDSIKRFGMWGIMVLAMVPAIQSGTGPNFALPVGVVCGLLAQVCAIEWGFGGFSWLIVSFALAIVLATVVGYIYGRLMNAVKGSEMTIATYTGFSITALFCLVWLLVPFKDPRMGWMLGQGLRETIQLDAVGSAQILNKFLKFEIFGVTIPTGMLLVFFAACLVVWLFFRSRTGIAISAGGINPMFAKASGLDIDKSRVTANMISTVFGALGIIVYSQSYGYVQLYVAPLYMAFQAVAAVLIGGATAQRAKIFHVIVGTLIFQGLIANAMPVANKVFAGTDLSEILRTVIQNGVILYALTQVKGGGK